MGNYIPIPPIPIIDEVNYDQLALWTPGDCLRLCWDILEIMWERALCTFFIYVREVQVFLTRLFDLETPVAYTNDPWWVAYHPVWSRSAITASQPTYYERTNFVYDLD